MNRKSLANVFYLCFFGLACTLFSFACVWDPSVVFKNEAYAFLRTLSASDIDWASGIFVPKESGVTTTDLRKTIDEAETKYGFSRSTLTSHVVALDSNGDFAKLPCSFLGESFEPTSIITLASFCDGKTSSDGKLSAIPIQIMFNGPYCDVSKYRDTSSDSASYISKDFADGIIASVPGLKTYEDLLGKVFTAGPYNLTISNIFYPTSYLAPLYSCHYGKYIIVDKGTLMDDFNIAIAASVQADTISFEDFVRFWQRKNFDAIDFVYKNDNAIVRDTHCQYTKAVINSHKPTEAFEGWFFWLALGVFFLNGAALIALNHMLLLSRTTFQIVLLAAGCLLAVVTLLNLFFPGAIWTLNLFNGYLSFFCVETCLIMVAYPLVFRLTNKEGEKRALLYEMDL